MKIGYINYLNCYPFYYRMFEIEPVKGIEIVPDYPGNLNSKIASGEISLSPVSAAAYADIQDRALILPQFCLSSVGYVRSVSLISRIPIEDLGGKKVGLTTASATSVNLLKILLEKYYSVKPVYVSVPPKLSLENVDAALIIGNDAMLPPPEPVEYTYDLGDLWLRKTGHPVVFAVFVLLEEALEENKSLIASVIDSYSLSLAELRSNEPRVVACAAKKYPDIKYDISHYYDLLKFDFGDDFKKALMFYFNEAHSLGLLNKVHSLKFYN
jgi:chorismate dehydratase